MAVVNVKSQVITDLDASPLVKQNQIKFGARVRSEVGLAAFAASDATSVARIVRIPSRARIVSTIFQSDDLGTGGTVDVGLHRISAHGGAVVDADFIKAAIDTDTAAVAKTNIYLTGNAATVGAIANVSKRVWEILGLTVDPGVDYDITITRNTATGTGNVALDVQYLLDE